MAVNSPLENKGACRLTIACLNANGRQACYMKASLITFLKNYSAVLLHTLQDLQAHLHSGPHYHLPARVVHNNPC